VVKGNPVEAFSEWLPDYAGDAVPRRARRRDGYGEARYWAQTAGPRACPRLRRRGRAAAPAVWRSGSLVLFKLPPLRGLGFAQIPPPVALVLTTQPAAAYVDECQNKDAPSSSTFTPTTFGPPGASHPGAGSLFRSRATLAAERSQLVAEALLNLLVQRCPLTPAA